MNELKYCQKCNFYKKDEDNYCSHCGMELIWYLPKELEVWIENHDHECEDCSYKQDWYYPNWKSVEFFVNPEILSGERAYRKRPEKGIITDPVIIREILTSNELTYIEGNPY